MEKQQTVSTEAQRLALEAMSAQLVHKLNAMIAEQEARTRAFAEQHHTHIELPQPLRPVSAPTIETETPLPKPPPAPRANQTSRKADEKPGLPPASQPLRIGPKKKAAKPEEENNIGLGMVIFSLVGIVILLRSCS